MSLKETWKVEVDDVSLVVCHINRGHRKVTWPVSMEVLCWQVKGE